MRNNSELKSVVEEGKLLSITKNLKPPTSEQLNKKLKAQLEYSVKFGITKITNYAIEDILVNGKKKLETEIENQEKQN